MVRAQRVVVQYGHQLQHVRFRLWEGVLFGAERREIYPAISDQDPPDQSFIGVHPEDGIRHQKRLVPDVHFGS